MHPAFAALALLSQLSLVQAAGDDAGTGADAWLPALPPVDGGTVDVGGAGQDVPESDDATGRVPTTCRQSLECERGFSCVDGRCTWTAVRSAAGPGCLGASAAFLWTPLAALLLRRPRNRTRP
ncbi:MAG: hypothetical protein FJ086_13030 [Deltaproteobacteria bacterium]|nr:hypothetical protein [Deltaproteobacteria bacterium]